jgi:predicted DNA-binding protein YlxM (UPF0122 family)
VKTALTEQQRIEIKQKYMKNVPILRIAEQYHVCTTTINNICGYKDKRIVKKPIEVIKVPRVMAEKRRSEEYSLKLREVADTKRIKARRLIQSMKPTYKINLIYAKKGIQILKHYEVLQVLDNYLALQEIGKPYRRLSISVNDLVDSTVRISVAV